jgi:esterase/lipase
LALTGPGAAARRAGSAEHLTLLIAVGVIALHVADDNFLQPEPGTAAGDHLLSGLVPLGCLGVAAAVYRGRRAGLRASIAILIGLFGIVAGLEGWHYLTSATPSGDDFTSLLSLPAGLVLIGLAASILWRSRRTDDGLVWRYIRRALIGIAAVAAGLLLVTPFLVAYGTTHLARGFVPEADLGVEYEDVTFTTADGLELEGWHVPSENGAAVISFPGRKGPQDPARLLAEHGYGVLLFDRRGEGESEGDPNAWGWGGYRDVDAAVEFLRGRGVDPERIGGIGQSVGGEMMLEAAARSDGLQAVVSEGAGVRSVREATDLPDSGPLQELGFALQTVGVALFSNEPVPEDLADLVGRIAPRPILLIQAQDGQGGEELNADYFEAAGQPKELWVVAEGGHVGSQDAEAEEFERRVVGFFDEALLGRSN